MHTLNVIVGIFLSGLLLMGCGNFLTNENEKGHAHALSETYRLALVMNEIVVIEENKLSGGGPGQIVVNAEAESPPITLEATDDHGHAIHLDELEDHYSLSYNENKIDGDVAAFEQHEDERWIFHIHGRTAALVSTSRRTRWNARWQDFSSRRSGLETSPWRTGCG